MKRFRSALASAALCLAAVFSSGQSLSFTHLGIDNGLSQQSVNSIHVDENGLIWIGTNYGLNCFDGKTVTTFLSDRQDSGTLLNNNVSIITGDGSGKLFILCIGGISQYDLHTRKFSTLRRGNINSIFYSDALYICEENKILKYDELTGEAEVFFRFEDESLFASTMSIYGSTIYIGTYSDGLYALDIETRSLSHLIEKANIISIFRDSKRNIWTGTFMNGLFKISKDGKTTNYRHQENDPTSISSDFVRACREDDLGNIWIGTINGLNKYLPEDNIFVNNLSEYSYKQELSHPSIWSIAKDNQGTIWIGTYLGGVNYFNPEHEIYTRYAHMGAGHKPLGAPVVSRIIEGEEDDFWIATEEGLLHLKDKKTGEYEFLRHDSGRNSLSHDNIKALYFDAERNCLWIGTYLRGLDK